eukprot:TRINITY_DN19557_c0_g1_i1.p1 TRINITY_DN19557_c0_g1~~TRINITY_DN19557_c0_g1_i1.p1  ORF type:complete len:471 (-),score=155.58 TRINITY_DN19557_c0_g1_i1:408-1820(-)
MIRRPPRSTLSSSSAASDVYKRQMQEVLEQPELLALIEQFSKMVGCDAGRVVQALVEDASHPPLIQHTQDGLGLIMDHALTLPEPREKYAKLAALEVQMMKLLVPALHHRNDLDFYNALQFHGDGGCSIPTDLFEQLQEHLESLGAISFEWVGCDGMVAIQPGQFEKFCLQLRCFAMLQMSIELGDRSLPENLLDLIRTTLPAAQLGSTAIDRPCLQALPDVTELYSRAVLKVLTEEQLVELGAEVREGVDKDVLTPEQLTDIAEWVEPRLDPTQRSHIAKILLDHQMKNARCQKPGMSLDEALLREHLTAGQLEYINQIRETLMSSESREDASRIGEEMQTWLDTELAPEQRAAIREGATRKAAVNGEVAERLAHEIHRETKAAQRKILEAHLTQDQLNQWEVAVRYLQEQEAQEGEAMVATRSKVLMDWLANELTTDQLLQLRKEQAAVADEVKQRVLNMYLSNVPSP